MRQEKTRLPHEDAVKLYKSILELDFCSKALLDTRANTLLIYAGRGYFTKYVVRSNHLCTPIEVTF